MNKPHDRIKIYRKCNACGIDKTSIWHKDKWGKIGWVCHNCYNAIRYREDRRFDGIITRNRPTGLVYNK